MGTFEKGHATRLSQKSPLPWYEGLHADKVAATITHHPKEGIDKQKLPRLTHGTPLPRPTSPRNRGINRTVSDTTSIRRPIGNIHKSFTP